MMSGPTKKRAVKHIENVHNHGASLEAKLMAQLRVQTLPKPVMLKIILAPILLRFNFGFSV